MEEKNIVKLRSSQDYLEDVLWDDIYDEEGNKIITIVIKSLHDEELESFKDDFDLEDKDSDIEHDEIDEYDDTDVVVESNALAINEVFEICVDYIKSKKIDTNKLILIDNKDEILKQSKI